MLLFDKNGGSSGSAGGGVIEHRRRVEDPSRWVVKLSDFGVARTLDGGSASTFCGSPQYVAPEVLFARDSPAVVYTNAVDTWSLGVIMFVMLCGFLPFDQAVHGTCQRDCRGGHFHSPRHAGCCPLAIAFLALPRFACWWTSFVVRRERRARSNRMGATHQSWQV